MILVAGGNGTLGRPMVRLLMDAGHQVRVLTRDRKLVRDLPDDVELVEGDIRSAKDMAAAVRGCKTVVSAVHGFIGKRDTSPESIDRDGNRVLISAAAEAAVEHFVLVSVQAASPEHPMSLHRAKYAAEEMLKSSGLRFTIVRPTAFVETWMTVIGGALAQKGEALVFGPGTNPINFVSVRDVAAVVALAVSGRDATLSNAIVEIGGPENLSFVTIAERLVEASGKPGRIKHIPLAVLRVMATLARPFSPGFARQARAAVVMNTRDMTFAGGPTGGLSPAASTTLGDVLRDRSFVESAS
jgi:uncharacterized protein YbjT (DUF2867 family)